MEPYERVTAALERKPLDRVPMRWNARREVVDMMMAHLGVDSEEAILQRLGIDFRYVGMRYAGPNQPPKFVPKNAPVPEQKRSAVSTGGYTNSFRVTEPFANMQDVSELDAYEAHLTELLDYRDPSRMHDDTDRINKEQRYFVGYKSSGRVFMLSQELRGAEQFLMDMALNPEFAHRLLEILTVRAIGDLKKALDAAGDRIDVVQYNDDLGTQRALMMSPEMFREFLLPRYQRIFATVKEYGVRVFMHSCGAIRKVIPDLIDAGLDILNPVQTGAVEMGAEGLKRDFGDQLTFCGGIDVQSTLPFGSPEDVRQEVRDRIDVLGRDGGYILDSTNLLQPDTSAENVLAMFDGGRDTKFS